MTTTAFGISGTGPPVVLIHGMGLNRHMWTGQVAALEDRFTVLRYDILGHGESPLRPGPYDMADFVGQLHDLMSDRDIDSCSLVGFSLGGLIAQAFTLAHPEMVERLAILNAVFDRSDDERAGMVNRLEIAQTQGFAVTVEAALERWFTPEFAARRREVVEQVRRWMQANDRDAYAAIYKLLTYGDRDLAARLPDIRCQALVLTCQDDVGSPPAMAARMAQAIPSATLAVVPSLRHMGLMEDPAAVNGPLLAFLEG